MNLYIKQRVFTFGQKFDICDDDGNELFYCEGEIFTFGRKLHIFDKDNNEVIYIKQKLFRLMPRYEIYINGKLEAVLIKKFAFFRHNFYYEGVNWLVEGDFLAHDYRIMDGDELVMTISKKWFSWGDTYNIEINEKFNVLLALASCIVIDCACHEGSSGNNH